MPVTGQRRLDRGVREGESTGKTCEVADLRTRESYLTGFLFPNPGKGSSDGATSYAARLPRRLRCLRLQVRADISGVCEPPATTFWAKQRHW